MAGKVVRQYGKNIRRALNFKNHIPYVGGVSLTGQIFDPNNTTSYRQNVDELFNLVFTTPEHRKLAYEQIAPTDAFGKSLSGAACEKAAKKNNHHILEELVFDAILADAQSGELDKNPNADVIKKKLKDILDNNVGSRMHRRILEVQVSKPGLDSPLLDVLYSDPTRWAVDRKGNPLKDPWGKPIRVSPKGLLSDIRERARLGIPPTKDEQKYIRLIQSSGVPNGFLEDYKTGRAAGTRKGKEHDMIAFGKYLVPRLGKVKRTFRDPRKKEGENTRTVTETRGVFIDDDGKISRTALTPQTNTPAEIERARQNREDTQRMFEQSLLFGQISQKFGKKTDQYLQLHRYDLQKNTYLAGIAQDIYDRAKAAKKPISMQEAERIAETKRKALRLDETFFNNDEAQARYGQFTAKLAEDFSVNFSNRLHEHYHSAKARRLPNGRLASSGRENFRALISEDYIKAAKMLESRFSSSSDEEIIEQLWNDCFGKKGEGGYYAVLITNGVNPKLIDEGQRLFEANQKAGFIGPLTQSDHIKIQAYLKSVELTQHYVEDFYITYGVRAVRNPIRDESNEKIFDKWPPDEGGYVEYEDRGYADKIDRDAAAAFMRDVVGNAIGAKMFKNDGTIDANTDVVELENGINDIRVKVKHANGQIHYLDPDEYLETSLRQFSMLEAMAIQRQIQSFGRSPVAWWYNEIGNLAINQVPSLRAATDFAQNIIKGRFLQLPKPEQAKIDLKGLQKSATEFVKRSFLSPLYAYDPATGILMPRIWYATTYTTGLAMDWLTGSETSDGIFDKLAKRLKIRVWRYNPDKRDYEKEYWQPRMLRGIFRSKRQRQGLLETAVRLAAGLVFRGAVEGLVGQFKFATRFASQINYISKFPQRIIDRFVPTKTLNFFNRLWLGTKAGLAVGQAFVKSGMKAVMPAVVAGIAFNSPIAFALTFGVAFAPSLATEIAYAVGDHKILTEIKFLGLGDNLDTLSDLITTPRGQINSVFKPEVAFNDTRSLFGIKMYKYDPITGIATRRFNPTTFRGLVKGIGNAAMAFNIAYLLTGNLVTAAAIGGATIVGTVVWEHFATRLAEAMPKIQGMIKGVSGAANMVGNVALSGVSVYTGLQFMKETFEAFTGGEQKLREYWDTYWGGILPFTTTALTILGFVQGISTIYATAVKLGSYIIARFGGAGLTIPVGRWAVASMIVGGIIGAIVGGSVGAAVGGAIVGGLLGTGLAVLGTIAFGAIGGAIGWAVGTAFGGWIGGKLGAWIETKLGGVLGAMNGLAKFLGGALNLIQAFKLLMSGDAGNIAVGAFMIAISGVVSLAAVNQMQTASASYVVSDGAGEPFQGDVGTPLPKQISNLNKAFTGFDSGNGDKTVTYKIAFTNNDPNNKSIKFNLEDNLALDKNADVSSDPTFSSSDPGSIKVTRSDVDLGAGENFELTVSFTHTTTSFKGDGGLIDQQGNKRLCNTVNISGSTSDGAETFNGSDTICIDKDGKQVGSGGGPVYSGTVIEIYEQVKVEMGLTGKKSAWVEYQDNPECGTSGCWCDFITPPKLKCETATLEARLAKPNGEEYITKLFRHELTHVIQYHGKVGWGEYAIERRRDFTEWGAEYVSVNGGGYCFLDETNNWVPGSKIGEKMISRGCDLATMDQIAFGDLSKMKTLEGSCGVSPRTLIQKRGYNSVYKCY